MMRLLAVLAQQHWFVGNFATFLQKVLAKKDDLTKNGKISG
jgi:hypothetical protein